MDNTTERLQKLGLHPGEVVIPALLDRLEAAEREAKILSNINGGLVRDVNARIADLSEIETQLDAANARIRALEEALTWYADPERYKPHPHGSAFDRRDISYVAKSALEAGR